MDSQMAIVESVGGNQATIELGNGETKGAAIPVGLSLEVDNKVLVVQVSGKYLIISSY